MRQFIIAILLSFFSLSAFSKDPALWIVEESNPRVSLGVAKKIIASIKKHSSRHHLDPNLVLRVIHLESRFNPRAVSAHGAIGLMQVIPKYHQKLIRGRDLFNIDVNIEVGVTYLASCLRQHKSVNRALRTYNGSPRSNRYPDKISKINTNKLDWLATDELIINKEEPMEVLGLFASAQPI